MTAAMSPSRVRLRRAVALAVGMLATLTAFSAAACPVCAQRSEGGVLRTVSLGVLIVAPWCIALAIGLYIRRGLRASQAGSETTQ